MVDDKNVMKQSNPGEREREHPAYTLQIRCGKEGGGKGALVQTELSATLSCANVQYLFQPGIWGEYDE